MLLKTSKPIAVMFTLECPLVLKHGRYTCPLTSQVRRAVGLTLSLSGVQAGNLAGLGPFSEAVLCQTPCSVPAAVSSIHALKESALRRQEAPADEEDEDDGSRTPPLYSPSSCLGLSWEPPCDHGSEITSYLIDLGERQPVAVGPVTKHIIQNLQPDTSYRSALPPLTADDVLHNFAPFRCKQFWNCWILV